MNKLILTDEFVRDQILQIAPIVTTLTGWNLKLDTLRSRVLPKKQGYEEILLGRLNHIGIDDWEEVMPNFLERMIEYLIEENTLAAYMPGMGEILVVRENVDDSNLDGLKLILAHELVHRGQDIVHGHLFVQVDHLLQRSFAEMKSETTDFMTMRLYLEQIQPIMTLVESHATYIQSQIAQTYFPNAHIENSFNLARLLMRLVGAPKLAQYTDGLPQVAAAMQRGKIDYLFRGLASS